MRELCHTRGCNEADTLVLDHCPNYGHLPSLRWENQPTFDNNAIVRSHYLLRQPLPSHPIQQFPSKFPLKSLYILPPSPRPIYKT
jgi:hypothetical protein